MPNAVNRAQRLVNNRVIQFLPITRLIYGRWAHHYDEHHSPYEDAITANLGPFRLSANFCFVLDHRDAGVSLTLPLPGGKLYLSYTVCLGEEPIRQSGWRAWWQRPYVCCFSNLWRFSRGRPDCYVSADNVQLPFQ